MKISSGDNLMRRPKPCMENDYATALYVRSRTLQGIKWWRWEWDVSRA